MQSLLETFFPPDCVTPKGHGAAQSSLGRHPEGTQPPRSHTSAVSAAASPPLTRRKRVLEGRSPSNSPTLHMPYRAAVREMKELGEAQPPRYPFSHPTGRLRRPVGWENKGFSEGRSPSKPPNNVLS
jgi:hypothetical protein